MEETGNRDANTGEDLGSLVIDPQRFLTDVFGADREDRVENTPLRIPESWRPFQDTQLMHEILPVDKPNLAQDDKSVGRKHDSEGRNRRREVRREQRLHRSRRLLKMQQQWQRGDRQQRKRKYQRELGDFLEVLLSENVIQG